MSLTDSLPKHGPAIGNKPFKVLGYSKNKCGIYCHSGFGPIFRGKDDSDDDEAGNAKDGSDNVLGDSDVNDDFNNEDDIVIASNSNKNHHIYSDFGFGYKNPEYQYETVKAKLILAGSYTFKTVEIEVYTKLAPLTTR